MAKNSTRKDDRNKPVSKRQFTKIKKVEPRNQNQEKYLNAVETNSLTIASGPAGTGKTHLAVYEAICHHFSKRYKRIIITRPAVEAGGEKLGFLPGELQNKLDPYLRPIFDSLYEIIGVEQTQEKIQRGYIEIAPLAYMRGRAQPLDSLLATPEGFITMEDVGVGTEVLGSDGSPIYVTGVFPQGQKDIFLITFLDGSTVKCSEDHLWLTRTRSEKRHEQGFSVKTTKDIINTLKVANNVCNHEVPVISAPGDFSSQEVPLDPYLIGALLGDGSLHEKASITLTSVDTDVIESARRALPDGISMVQSGKSISYRLVSRPRKRGSNILRRHLELLGLIGTKSFNKFVPNIYKYNSVEVRIAVLQGLLDTDGSVMSHRSGHSRVQFYSTSEQLADDVRFIVQSLGGTATKLQKNKKGQSHTRNGKEIVCRRDCFVLDIRLPAGIKPFRLPRKLERFTETPTPQRLITSVEYIGTEECQCISVSAEDRLYATDSFILTHNTFNNCFVILDEAQNATLEQLEMAVTRIGNNAKMVINGDPKQTDLPGKNNYSGLKILQQIAQGIPDVAVIEFGAGDIVRSEVVTRLVRAFERYEEESHKS